MVSKLIVSICTIYYSFGCLLMVVNARSTKYKELKPVLIKSVVSHPRIPYNNLDTPSSSSSQSSQEQEEGLTSRKIYQFPGPGHHHNIRGPPPPAPQQQDPERGQILHRPKSGRRNSQTSSTSSQSNYQNQNEMPNDAPMLLNGKGKKVKYVPTMGYQGPEKPPQVYVISSGGDEDEESSNNNGGNGVVGSMQTYFKSMTGRIRAAFQGLIGGITD